MTDYELIDSGEGEKLERFGDFLLRRPDPQALWLKAVPERWAEADLSYERVDSKKGSWKSKKGVEVPESWHIEIEGINMIIKPSAFKHVGIFPEQAINWRWLREIIAGSERETHVLNLFGYTGGASVVCAKAGAKVTHVDSSKTSITQASENAKLNELEDIRWILEDAHEFVKKEMRRGKKYEGIIMDPPAFGHGTEGEIWEIEKQFTDLVADVVSLLSPEALFFLMSGYAAGYSSITYMNNLLPLREERGGSIEHGELTLRESEGNRDLPAGIFARWSNQ